MKYLLLLVIGFGLIGISTSAYADHLPGSMLSETECSEKMGRDCFCWEQGTCKFTEDPLAAMLKPYDAVFGGLALVIFWALVVGLLWLRTESPQLVGIVGIAMVSSYMAYLETTNTLTTPEFEAARVVGITLLVISFGIAFYHMIVNRILSGPT